jgi:hypothetical protein
MGTQTHLGMVFSGAPRRSGTRPRDDRQGDRLLPSPSGHDPSPEPYFACVASTVEELRGAAATRIVDEIERYSR